MFEILNVGGNNLHTFRDCFKAIILELLFFIYKNALLIEKIVIYF